MLLCSSAQQVVGAGIGTETVRDTMYNCYNYQRQSHIISSKNATAGAVGPFYWALKLGAERQNE